MAGSCSVAISAGCHWPEGDIDALNKPVMWGAVESHYGIGFGFFTRVMWKVFLMASIMNE